MVFYGQSTDIDITHSNVTVIDRWLVQYVTDCVTSVMFKMCESNENKCKLFMLDNNVNNIVKEVNSANSTSLCF